MNRRIASKSLAAAAIASLIGFLLPVEDGSAQPPAKVHRVALIFTTAPLADLAGPEPIHPFTRAFLRAMRERGYVEGRNFILERRTAGGRWHRTTEIVADLVRLQTDVIVIANTDLALRAVKVARDVPLVVMAGDDLVRAGLARSLAKPGGNVTGTTTDVDEGTELKRLELFLALLPKAPRVAFIGTKQDWSNAHGTAMRAAATTRGAKVFHAASLKARMKAATKRRFRECAPKDRTLSGSREARRRLHTAQLLDSSQGKAGCPASAGMPRPSRWAA